MEKLTFKELLCQNYYYLEWKDFQTIKNALVMMIVISEYIDNTKWPDLQNAKKRFKQLFQKKLNYEFECNQSRNTHNI
ncbi:hypothetical protein RFI_38132 [Reticulomyxa filosa]|uniref:Uncharacterized protein n=1 Tax=Reticulomyxa filosa TaxID=46433 RepID=X6LF46_RETFI|nr:hypothetical protein RFI_38132 [Reticulomyxa filosa]|eukprot:ETN99349.1 hypothetical protein RFI_38132 [Reticulomyxa filosa]